MSADSLHRAISNLAKLSGSWPLIADTDAARFIDLVAEEIERLRTEVNRPGSQSAWAQMKLERDLAREEIERLRAKLLADACAATKDLLDLRAHVAELEADCEGHIDQILQAKADAVAARGTLANVRASVAELEQDKVRLRAAIDAAREGK